MKKMNKKTKNSQRFFSGQTWFYITRRILPPEYANDIHWHDYYEMEFVVEGQGSNLIDGISYSMKKGSAFLLTPASFHVISGDRKTPLTLYHLEFDDSILEHGFPHSVISQFSEKETEELLLLFQMLEEEFLCQKSD